MAEYIIEIGDEKGKSFKMLIASFNQTWRTLDKGFICYNNGWWVLGENSQLYFKTTFDMQARDFWLEHWSSKYMWQPNGGGRGYIEQKNVLALDPGILSWTMVEQRGWF